MKSWLPIILILITLISCGKEEFASIKQSVDSTAPITLNSSLEVCANHTLVKPYVDFLFLWDNTSSQTFVNSGTKEALANTVGLISERFDYRILLAPMVAEDNDYAFILSSTDTDLSTSAKSMLVSIDDAYSKLLSFPTTSKSHENGIQRSVDLIDYNNSLNNGIFRKNSYLVIVLMSNGNDQINTSSGIYNGTATTNYLNQNLDKLRTISSEENLDTIYTRFISLVGHSECNSGWRIGESYKTFSKLVHQENFDCEEDDALDLQCSSSTPDSHDICQISFTNLFDAVNDSIIETIIKHKYNYWPISYQKDPINFNIETLKVSKSNGEEYFEVPSDDSSNLNGWRFIGWKDDQPTTYEPFVGEEKSAHFIELLGDARVSYPECLVIQYDSPTYYYGYLSIPHKPLVSSIVVKENGAAISSDLWEYVGYVETQNIRVQGPNNPEDPMQEFFPAESLSGQYIIKLDDNLIYKNDEEARFQVLYNTTTD